MISKPTFFICICLALSACTSKEQRQANHKAEQEARNAAETVLALDSVAPIDSFALERAILDAKALQSQYIISGNQEASDVFDKTFREIVTSRRPDLAQEIFIHDAGQDE